MRLDIELLVNSVSFKGFLERVDRMGLRSTTQADQRRIADSG
jgi:hypothetical protein